MIIIITGKAGSGKTTLRKLLLEKLANQNFSCFSCNGEYARIIGLKLSWQPDGQFGRRFLRNYELSFVLMP